MWIGFSAFHSCFCASCNNLEQIAERDHCKRCSSSVSEFLTMCQATSCNFSSLLSGSFATTRCTLHEQGSAHACSRFCRPEAALVTRVALLDEGADDDGITVAVRARTNITSNWLLKRLRVGPPETQREKCSEKVSNLKCTFFHSFHWSNRLFSSMI